MNKVFLSIGSNIGFKKQNLSNAIDMLKNVENISIDLESSTYKTKPLYNHHQAYFFNKVIKITTKLNPYKLLEKIKYIIIANEIPQKKKNGIKCLGLNAIISSRK